MVISAEILENAAQRWRDRAPVREIEKAQAESNERPLLRLRRLKDVAAKAKARLLNLEAEAVTAAATPVAHDFALERIMGKSDLLDTAFLELAVAMARPVARIKMSGGFGTGFLVGPGLLMTNNHVLGDAREAGGAVAEFDYQENRSGELMPVHAFKLLPDRFFLTSEPLDFTIVRLAATASSGREIADYGWVKLIAEQGKADTGDCINIVQHPLGGLKQIALRENEVVDIFDDFVHYVTDTEPGSSGSPCFNDQWELVALHHSGVPKTDAAGRMLRDDGRIWRKGVDSPNRLGWAANEGVRVSSIVKALNAAEMDAEGERSIESILTLDPPNPIELARERTKPAATVVSVPAAVPGAVAHVAAPVGSVVIPLQITVALGQTVTAPISLSIPAAPVETPKAMAAAAGAVSISVPAPAEPAEKIEIDANYGNRQGYAEEFIPGFRIPLPKMSEALRNNAVVNTQAIGTDKFRLDYEHYTVVMHKRRRLAIYTVVNIDGKQKQQLPPRQADTWAFDPRIDRKSQIGGDAYSNNVLDKGHLVRRLDPAWGATAQAAKKGNDDTFHYTNCSPQHKEFNQGGDLWQGLENFLLDKAQDELKKMTVFTGPVLRAQDPLYKNEKMDAPIRIPMEFWKVAALTRKDGSKATAAFIVSQADLIGDASLLDERFEPRTFQVRLSRVEKLTGLDFGDLRNFDTMGAPAGPLERSENEAALVESPDAIRI